MGLEVVAPVDIGLDTVVMDGVAGCVVDGTAYSTRRSSIFSI